MSIDQRYEAYLCDLMSLLQEGMLRFLTQKAIDIKKFSHYFNKTINKMSQLEQSFHQQKLKISTHMLKLKQYLKPKQKRQLSFERTSKDNKELTKDKPVLKPSIRYISAHKTSQQSQELRSIQQQDEDLNKQQNKRRSETATGSRSRQKFNAQQNGRPFTGQANKRQKINHQSFSKTIDLMSENFIDTQENRNTFITAGDDGYILDSKFIRERRKSIYDDISKETIYQPIIYRESKNISYKTIQSKGRKWSYQISRLF